MKYNEWIEFAEKVFAQYHEGAILASEAFNVIISVGVNEVEQEAEVKLEDMDK